MKQIKDMLIGELAALICSHLNDNGIICTLSGGACVSIYSNNKYQSGDIDFIENESYPRKKLVKLMTEIGFVEKNRYFTHKNNPLFIEFPAGPLACGSEPVIDIIEIKYDTGILRIISPTECVKDRLAAYYFWDDFQAFEQAILVAKDNPVNMNEIERWSIVENYQDKFKKFKEQLNL
jgi:hypothetical protein